MTKETRYQLIARAQAERQAKRQAQQQANLKTLTSEARKQAKWRKMARRERAYIEWATSDFPNQPEEDNESESP